MQPKPPWRHGCYKNHREITARRQSTISRWSVLETVSGSFGYHWRRAF